MHDTSFEAHYDFGHRTFIRAAVVAKMLNFSLEELNSWAKPKNFDRAKIPAYYSKVTNGTWFELSDVMSLYPDRELGFGYTHYFKTFDPTKETN